MIAEIPRPTNPPCAALLLMNLAKLSRPGLEVHGHAKDMGQTRIWVQGPRIQVLRRLCGSFAGQSRKMGPEVQVTEDKAVQPVAYPSSAYPRWSRRRPVCVVSLPMSGFIGLVGFFLPWLEPSVSLTQDARELQAAQGGLTPEPGAEADL